MITRVPFFAANWKMNLLISEVPGYTTRLLEKLGSLHFDLGSQYEVVLTPSFTHLPSLKEALSRTQVRMSAQNCGVGKCGAFTGEISPVVLKELGCEWTLIGHSERRHLFKEDNVLLGLRCKAAAEESLGIIFCAGEVLQDRKAGKTFKVLENQLEILKGLPPSVLAKLVIAYEPVWAIGTGENATPAQAQQAHAFIREWFSRHISADQATRLRILYGGSVKAENSESIMVQPDVDGLLVGGASLDPISFFNIVSAGLKGKMAG
jgi:triosephosphate isomerase